MAATLQDIQNKVRRLVRAPTEAQLSTADLNNYINTFVIYDFPEHLRNYCLRKQFTFITNPYQDVYPTDTASFAGVTTNPLYNFQNKYLTIHEPLYIAGYQSFYSQSREQFFGIYPMVNSIASIGTAGDGVTTHFVGNVNVGNTGTINYAILQNNVLFDSIDSNNNGLSLVDVPVVSTVTGNPKTIGNLYTPSTVPATPPTVVLANNNINYATGAFNITFSGAPAVGAAINSQIVPSITSLPQAMLFYENKFTIRPVPDQPYRVNFEVYVVPTALLNSTDTPVLQEWWQYIAYGAAKKVFEDRLDLESVQMIMPEFKTQERLCIRRTIVQNTNERAATIYTEQTGTTTGGSGWGWGSGGSF